MSQWRVRFAAWRHRVRVLAYFFLRHRAPCFWIVVCSLLSAGLEAAMLALLLPLLQQIVGSEAGTVGVLGGAGRRVVEVLRLLPIRDPLIASCAVLLAVHLTRQAVITWTEWLIASTTARGMSEFRKHVYGTYADASYAFFLDQKGGELLYNGLILPAKSLAVALLTVPRFLVEACRVVGLFLLLWWLNPRVAVVLVATIGVLYLPSAGWIGKRLYHTGVMTRNLYAQLSIQLNELFLGIKQIVVGNAKTAYLNRLDSVNHAWRTAYRRELFIPALPGHILEAVALTGVLGAVLALHRLRPADWRTSLPMLGLFGLAVIRMLPAFIVLGRQTLSFASFMPDLERLYGIVHATVPRAPTGRRTARGFRRDIVFDRVTFGYPNRPLIFSDLSLAFAQGQVSAITGASGAGKTTMFNLILGLYEPTSGRILIDGADLREMDRTFWYRQIGLVSQEMFLFHASVLENIRLLNDAYTPDQVEAAARQALAHDFIMQLPNGYQTVVGERGMRLSGGQQQRIALARAVLHQPEILLLDEATSALDNESERLMQEAIRRVAVDRTVIAIAHRASTIQRADRIYVIEHGSLVGDGRHEELLVGNAHYQRLQQVAP